MISIKEFIDTMKEGNAQKLASLFDDTAMFYDNSEEKVGKKNITVHGKMSIEMIFHNKFGMNGGPFPISGETVYDENCADFIISNAGKAIYVHAFINERTNDKIKRLNILAY